MKPCSPQEPRLLSRLALLLLPALLAVEGGAFALLAQRVGGTLPVTSLSVAVGAMVLAVGLLPALLRPNALGLLAGCFSILFASFLSIVFDFASLTGEFPLASVLGGPGFGPLRLVNGALAAAAALHLTARLPALDPALPRPVVRSPWLLAAYGITLALLVALLLSPVNQQLFLLVPLIVWLLLLLGGSLLQLIAGGRAALPATPRAARQARLLLGSGLFATMPLFLRPLLFAAGVDIGYDAVLVGQLFLPVGISYAILRHDLFGIDAALRRTVAYATLSFLLLALYLGLTVALTALLARAWAPFRGLAALVALFAAAAAFEPLRRRVQRTVDRFFYPERLIFQREVAHARATLAHVLRREQVITLLTVDLPTRLGSAWATLTLAPAPEVAGQPGGEGSWNAPLVVGGAKVGRYWLGPRPTGLPYDADEQEQLQALVQESALALAYADTFEALGTLNRELEARVAERTKQLLEQQRTLAVVEERQRLARELHDSVTQTLFSLSLSLRAIRGLLRREPEAVSAALVEQEQAAQQALVEMRALLFHLRTGDPLASPLELPQALRTHCAVLERQLGFQVTLSVPDALAIPPPLAADLLAIVREALHNAMKHAGTHAASCAVDLADGHLRLTVTDEGRGFVPDAPTEGVGLRGIRERVAALGGKVEVDSAPGRGTTVRVMVEGYGSGGGG